MQNNLIEVEEAKCSNEAVEEKVTSPRPAGFWIRVVASILDSLIFLPVTALVNYNQLGLKSLALMLLLTIPNLIYKPFMESYFGATLGKMAVRIKVTDAEGERLSLLRAYYRFTPELLTLLVTTLANFYLFSAPGFSAATSWTEVAVLRGQTGNLGMVANLIGILVLVDVLFVPFTKQKRAIHDFIAHSYCVHK